jgi:hypothetical protein
MSDDNKYQKFVHQLIYRTETGMVKWTDTADEDAFRAQFRGAMVRVQRREYYHDDIGQVTEYSLVLLDEDGREADEYRKDEKLVELWNVARRSARNAEVLLDRLLDETS